MMNLSDANPAWPEQAIENLKLKNIKADELPQKVSQAWDAVKQEYRNLKSVKQVAELVEANYHSLRASFRRHTRLTLEEHLTISRVLASLQLMKNSDLLIKEVAWAVGFRHEVQLSRAMKKWLDVTPQVIKGHLRSGSLVQSSLHRAQQIMRSNLSVK